MACKTETSHEIAPRMELPEQTTQSAEPLDMSNSNHEVSEPIVPDQMINDKTSDNDGSPRETSATCSDRSPTSNNQHAPLHDVPAHLIAPSIELADDGSNPDNGLSKSAMPPRLPMQRHSLSEERASGYLEALEDEYPEGGLRAYLVVIGSCFASFVTLGLMNTVGPINQYLASHQLKDYDVGTTGWIFSIFIFIGFFGGIQTGPLFDVYGPRMLVLSGSICISLSMMLFGSCTELWHFILCFGILGGIGASLIFTPAISAVGHFFLRKRGMATGIAAVGGSLGGITFPLMLQSLVPAVGFTWATRAVGFLVIFSCALSCILIRSRLPPKASQTIMPDLKILGQQRAYLLLTLGIYFMEWALFIPITYITSFTLSTHVLNSNLSYQLIAILNAGSCVGRAVPGYLADVLGPFNTMISALTLCTVTTAGLWLPASVMPLDAESGALKIEALTIFYVVIFGIASGSNVSLGPVCVGKLCGTTEYGRYYATCYSIVSFGTLTGIPIAGALIRIAGGYWGVVLWTTSCYAASLLCLICSRACCVGWKIRIRF